MQFCVLGAYMEIIKKVMSLLGHKFFPIAYIVLMIVNFWLQSVYINRILIFLGIFALWYVEPWLVKRNYKIPAFLTAGSFFIYASHMELLKGFSRTFFKHSPILNDFVLVGFLFVQVIVALGVALFLNKICRTLFPKFAKNVMGAR